MKLLNWQIKKIITISILFLMTLQAFGQTKTWVAAVPGTGRDNTSSWYNPNNWAPIGVPLSTDNVYIPAATNTCFIPDVAATSPVCNRLIVYDGAAVFNQSGLSVGGFLTIEQDLIILDGGYFFSEAKQTIIKRDLRIHNRIAGAPSGSLIVIDNDNLFVVGRHFVNAGTMAKRQTTGTVIRIQFNGNSNAFLYANNADNHNQYSNSLVTENITTRAGFNFSYLFPSNNILKTGAFDEIEVNKDNRTTLQNSSDSTAINATGVPYPIMAGTVDASLNKISGSNGLLKISKGWLIVNNVASSTLGGSTPTLYDGTTLNARGTAWSVPNADIFVAGNLEVANANFGASSYSAAGINLFTATTKRDIAIHIGGSVTDFNVVEPSGVAGSERGFYIGPVDRLPESTSPASTIGRDYPFVVFRGNENQDLRGFYDVRDHANIPNQGKGMVLPNVIVNKSLSTDIVRIFNSNMRVLGDLTIFSGEFSINGNTLLMGDEGQDEINVCALGNPAGASPTSFGTLHVSPGSRLLFTATSYSSLALSTSNTELQRGVILRARRGSWLRFNGTPSLPVDINRDSRIGGRVRIAAYSGAYVEARFASFNFGSKENAGTGGIIGYGLNGAVRPTTPGNNDNWYHDATTPSASGNIEGGVKIYPGAILVRTTVLGAPIPNADAFSDCEFNAANQNICLVIDTDLTSNGGAAPVTGDVNIYYTVFNGADGDNRAAVSKNNTNPRKVTMWYSSGSMGGINGESRDGNRGTSIGCIDGGAFDRIVWNNNPRVEWVGNVSTSWNDWQNWRVPDQTGGPNTGGAQNPDRLVPGLPAGGGTGSNFMDFREVNVIIPRTAVRDCFMDVNVEIQGAFYINDRTTGTNNRALTIQNGASRVLITNDLFMYRGGTFNANDGTIQVKGNLGFYFARTNTATPSTAPGSPDDYSRFNAGTSTLIANGSSGQNFNFRHNSLYNFTVNKASGTLIVTGYISGGAVETGGTNQVWTLRVDNNFKIVNGGFRLQSNSPADVGGNFEMSGGTFDALATKLTVRGNFKITGGNFLPGSSTVQLYPKKGTSTLKNIELSANTSLFNLVLGDGDNTNTTGTGVVGTSQPNIMQAIGVAKTYQQGYMLIRMQDGGSTFLQHNFYYEQVANIADSTGNVTYTYRLLTDAKILGTTTVYGNRVLWNQGFNFNANNVNVERLGEIHINSTNTAAGQLQIASGKTLLIKYRGVLKLIGNSSRFVKLTRGDVVSSFACRIEGNIFARYYIAEYTDANGIELTATASTNPYGFVSYGGSGEGYTNPAIELFPLYEGSGATATAVLTGSPLTSVTVTNSGSGYTVSNPSVTASSGSATFSAVVEGSPVSSVVVNTSGSGYTSTPTITFSAPPSGTTATGSAIMEEQSVESVSISAGGSGYTTQPTVTFTGGGGAGAVGEAILAPSALTAATLTVGSGEGYVVGDLIYFAGSPGTGSYAEVTSVDGTGAVLTVTTTFSLDDYQFPINSDNTSGSGTGVIFTGYTVNATSVALVNVVTGGVGYSSAPTVSFSGGGGTGATATATVTAGDKVVGITITDAGSGYLAPPTVSFSGGGGTGATATATTDGGKITAINILTNDNYTVAPNITIAAPLGVGAVQAAATANTVGGQITSITLATAGTGYRVAPLVLITDPNPNIGRGASYIAKLTPSNLAFINVLNGGEGYNPATTQIQVSPTQGEAVAPFTLSSPANITVSNDVIKAFLITANGSGYGVGNTLIASGGSGTGAVFTVASITGVGTGPVASLSITNGGSGYVVGNSLTFTGGSGTGVTVQVTAVADGVITAISLPATYGPYTNGPKVVVIAGGGSNADFRAALQPTTVASVNLIPIKKFPAGAFSDGIFAASFYTGTALRVHESVRMFREGNVIERNAVDWNYGSDTLKTFAITTAGSGYTVGQVLNSLAPSSSNGRGATFRVTSVNGTGGITGLSVLSGGGGYTATTVLRLSEGFSAARITINTIETIAKTGTSGPRLDTIYNVIFPKNPAVDGGGNFSLSKNVTRNGTGNNPINRIVFKDAIGTFSGEDYDSDVVAANLAANSPDAYLNPHGIQTDSMIIWREPNVKRWDGGPNNLGTAWNDPANWRPDGVPTDKDNVIIDHKLMWIDYTTDPPTVKAPTPFVVDMNFAYTSTATCKNFSVDTYIQAQIAGGQSINSPITINVDPPSGSFRASGSFVIGRGATVTVFTGKVIEVGESWSNQGTFNHGFGLVDFYRNASRSVVSGVVTTKSPVGTGRLTAETNAFYDVKFSRGITDLSTDILAKRNLAIDADATLNSNNKFIYLEGNWTDRGKFLYTQGTVYFQGPNEQIVSRDTTIVGDIRNQKEDFFKITIDKNESNATLNGSVNHVIIRNRVEVASSGSVRFGDGRIIAARDREFIMNANALIEGAVSRRSYVQGPMGRVVNSSGVVYNLLFPVGSQDTPTGGAKYGTAVYVGNSSNSVALKELQINANKNTMFVVEQIEGNIQVIEGSRTLPANPPSKVNYISRERYWDIENLPYTDDPIDGNPAPAITLADNADLTQTRVALYFDANFETIQLSTPADPITVNALASGVLVDIKEGRVVMDSDAAYDAARGAGTVDLKPGTEIVYTPNNAATHDAAQLDGTAYRSDLFLDMGAVEAAANDINGTSLEITSNIITQLNNGNFALGFNYLPLPLEILDVKATWTGTEVLVEWVTITERAASYFVVERSIDGVSFEPISTVNAKGGIGVNNYAIKDTKAGTGINYYRIKQVDKDNTFEYTKIVSVLVTRESVLQVYPNPVQRGALLTVKLPEVNSFDTQISLRDMQGREVLITTVSSQSLVELSIPSYLTQGMYILEIKTNTSTFQRKIIIQ
ncbi:MAG: T9SS C-terminal target domain-containing protein [Cytophagales bacterium]|nr:MAG: T9SS C-terminal target domain-containing protein [Cytophagales bacterium]